MNEIADFPASMHQRFIHWLQVKKKEIQLVEPVVDSVEPKIAYANGNFRTFYSVSKVE